MRAQMRIKESKEFKVSAFSSHKITNTTQIFIHHQIASPLNCGPCNFAKSNSIIARAEATPPHDPGTGQD